MSKSQQSSPAIKAYYDPNSDTLTFTFIRYRFHH